MKITSGLSWTENERGFMLINPSKNKCLLLDNKGKKLWELILQGKLLEEIYETMLLIYYNSDSELIKNDINAFITLLKKEEFIITG